MGILTPDDALPAGEDSDCCPSSHPRPDPTVAMVHKSLLSPGAPLDPSPLAETGGESWIGEFVHRGVTVHLGCFPTEVRYA